MRLLSDSGAPPRPALPGPLDNEVAEVNLEYDLGLALPTWLRPTEATLGGAQLLFLLGSS